MKKSKLLLILAILVALTMVIAACGKDCAHETYSAWKITKAPTTDAEGEAIRVCAECGAADTTVVAKLSDTSVWTAASSTATHTSAGKIVYTSTTFGTVEVFVDRLNDHVYTEVATDAYLVSAADCTHAAVYRKSCVCGAVSTATFTSGNALGHDGKLVAATDAVHTATTLTNGTKSHYKCDRCGLLFSDAACTTEVTAESLVVVAAHTYGTWTLVSEPTCTVAGSVSHKCTVCNKVETNIIPAHDHVVSDKYVLVTETVGAYWDEDGTIYDGEDVASEFHAPVCSICNLILKNAKETHEFSDEYLIIKEAVSGGTTLHEVLRKHKCNVCNYVEAVGDTDATGQILTDSLGYLEYAWTAGETVAATYTSDGYTEYTKDGRTVRLALPKLIAPYEGKTYLPVRVEPKDDVATGVGSLGTSWVNALLTLDNKGQGVGGGSPYNGNVTMTFDAATNAVTMTVVDLKGDSRMFNGYIEPLTGIMVIEDYSDGFAKPYIITPYAWTSSSNVISSYWLDAMAISYHIDCGTYTGHDITILVNGDEVMFGVTFENADGVIVAANECYAQDVLVVKSGDKVLATFVKDSDGELQVADEYRGEYKAVMDIDNTTDADLGKIVVDGIGGYVLVDADNAPSGTYQAVLNNDGELDYFDVYVIVDGNNVAHYHAAFVADAETPTIKLVAQTITITLDAGEQGTVEQITDDVYSNCVVTLPVPTANDNDAIFVRWMNGDVAVTATTTFTSDVTLNAVWATSAQLTIIDGDSTDEKTISVITPIMSVLPEYVEGETVNSANNTIFAGWYTTEDFSGNPIDDELTPGEEAVTVYAKWDVLGTWKTFESDGSFVYHADEEYWKTSVWNTTHYAYFTAIGGDIIVSFDFYFGSASGSYDTITIKNGTTTLVNDLRNSASGAPMAESKRHITALVKEGTQLTISTRWWSTNNSINGVYLSDFRINGRLVTVKGTADLMEGTYTCESKDDLVLNGYGSYIWGDKSGAYVKTGANTFGMYIVEGNVNTEYYAVTLDGTTYSMVKPDVEVSYNFGEINHSLTASTTNANITFTLPTEGLDVDGYVFRGWYDNAELTGSAITSVAPATDMVVYAKYDAAATITYNYNVDGVADKAVTGKFVNDKVETVEEIGEVTNPGKVYVGWFLKNGADDGDWGDQVSANTVISDVNVTYYAQWAYPHVLMGTWKGYRAAANFFTDVTTITIDAFGNITSTINNFKGASVITDSETGVMTISRPASGSGWSGIKAATLYIYYDADNGLMAVANGDGDKSANFGTSPYVLKKVDSADVETSCNNKFIAAWSGHLLDSFTIGDDTITFATDGTAIYVNPTVVAVDKEGVAIEGTDYLTLGAQITVTCGETTETLVYSGSNSDFKVATDTNRGVYTDATRGKVILDGVGNIWIGTEDTITGKYTVVETGKVSTTISKVYYEIVLNSNNTCVVTVPTAAVTYVVEHGTIDGDLTVNVGIKVEFTLPTVTPDAGYQFAGWYLSTDTDFTTPLTKHTLQSTDAISIVAKIDAMPVWASADTAEEVTLTDGIANITGETTSLNKVYYSKLVIPADGLYYIMFVNCAKVGGTGNNYANYARMTLFTAATCATDDQVTGIKQIQKGAAGNANLTAGTYYLVVSLGGQVSNNTDDDVYGTFSLAVQKADHTTADNAIAYVVGNDGTNAAPAKAPTVYTVELEAGKNYRITYQPDTWSQLKIFSDSGMSTSVTNTSWTGPGSTTKDFTVTTSGTYYFKLEYNCTFSIVEVTE